MQTTTDTEHLQAAIANLEYLIERSTHPQTRKAYEIRLSQCREQLTNLRRAAAHTSDSDLAEKSYSRATVNG